MSGVARQPALLRPDDLQALQRSLGNRAVQRMLKRGGHQAAGNSAGPPIQRMLFDTGTGLFVNYSYVVLPQGMFLMKTGSIPSAWPRALHADGEWVFYHPALVVLPPPQPLPAILPQPDLDPNMLPAQPQLDGEQVDGEQVDDEQVDGEQVDDEQVDEPGIETVQDLMDRCEYVDQDDQQNHYWIGTAVAYTYNLATCAAVALYHAPSGLSYLRHADAMTDPDQVQASVNEYVQEVLGWANDNNQNVSLANDFLVRIFVPDDVRDEPGSSLRNIRDGITQVGADQVVVDLFARAEVVRGMQRQHHVVVGGGEEPGAMDPGHPFSTLEHALRRIRDGEGPDAESLYGGTLLHVIQQNWRFAKPQDILDDLGDLVAEARGAASENGHDELARVLQGIINGETFQQSAPPSSLSDSDGDGD
ncbi:MAG TPA: hypothetical protein VFS21_16845 [Roseiflexaceae bacterium]|nr:hypothetical protein [Roseiflexaceae bacterium]